MVESQCTQCQHQVKGNVRFCPMCGSSMQQASQREARNCPRCQCDLKIHQYHDHQLDHCEQCHGLWLEPDEFRLLTTEFSVYRDPDVNPNYQKQALPQAEGYLPCACCGKLMTRQNFKAISGVIIDTCINCGVWLDHGELQQIRSFIASGGLDRAQDRQVSQQQRQIEQLDDRLSDVELMEKMLNKFNLKRIFFRGF